MAGIMKRSEVEYNIRNLRIPQLNHQTPVSSDGNNTTVYVQHVMHGKRHILRAMKVKEGSGRLGLGVAVETWGDATSTNKTEVEALAEFKKDLEMALLK